MAIALGHRDHTACAPLTQGARCTLVPARRRRAAAPENAGSPAALKPAGVLTVDDGAARALRGGASLLPAGVRAVEGVFARGDALLVKTAGGDRLGQGLTAYGYRDAAAIAGHRSEDIETLLGWRGRRRADPSRRSGAVRAAGAAGHGMIACAPAEGGLATLFGSML